MRRVVLGLITILSLAGGAQAQTYPSQSQTPITDVAEGLTPVQEAELAERIVQLEQQTDSDIAVVTLPAARVYAAGDDVRVYASSLVAAWNMAASVGDRHVLLLIFRDDKEVAIDVGAGFGVDGPAVSLQIIEDTILPALAADDYPGGIRDAIEAIASRILMAAEIGSDRPAGAADADAADGGFGALPIYIGAGLIALIALIVGANRRTTAKGAALPCPSCGKTGMTRSRIILSEPSATTVGRGETRTTCPTCGHVDSMAFSIAKLDTGHASPARPATGGKPRAGKARGGKRIIRMRRGAKDE